MSLIIWEFVKNTGVQIFTLLESNGSIHHLFGAFLIAFVDNLKVPIDVKKRCIDAESRRSFSDATPDEIEVDPDRIESWKSFVNFCQGLEFSLTINKDSSAIVAMEYLLKLTFQ